MLCYQIHSNIYAHIYTYTHIFWLQVNLRTQIIWPNSTFTNMICFYHQHIAALYDSSCDHNMPYFRTCYNNVILLFPQNSVHSITPNYTVNLI